MPVSQVDGRTKVTSLESGFETHSNDIRDKSEIAWQLTLTNHLRLYLFGIKCEHVPMYLPNNTENIIQTPANE